MTYVNGGTLADIVRTAAISYVTASALQGIGESNATDFAKVMGHGTVGGMTAVFNGGRFEDGFKGGVVGKLVTMGTPQVSSPYAQFAIVVMSGGIAAQLGGGKFEDGARSAAMGYLFNELGGKGFSSKIRPGGMPENYVRKVVEFDGVEYIVYQKPTDYLIEKSLTSDATYYNTKEARSDTITMVAGVGSFIAGSVGVVLMFVGGANSAMNNDNVGIVAATSGLISTRLPIGVGYKMLRDTSTVTGVWSMSKAQLPE